MNTGIQKRQPRYAARLVSALALVASGNALAWTGCEHERMIEATHDLAGVEVLAIDAAAGDLEVRGEAGSSVVAVRGKVCASKAEWAEEADVAFEGGERARLVVVLPEALEAYRHGIDRGRRYDVVIMDLTIHGGMGGREAIERLLEIDSDARAVVVSGYSNDPVMAEYERYGFRGCLVKPFRREQLARVVRDVIGKAGRTIP